MVVLADRIRSLGAPQWLGLFSAILLAWAALFAMAVPAELRALDRVAAGSLWEQLCLTTPDAAGWARLTVMWALMGAAMMLPTALPALATYDDLNQAGAETQIWALAGGYLAVWAGFAALAALAQIQFYEWGLIGAFGDSRSQYFSAAVLAVAGLYQFSPLKEACLSACQAPLLQFMAHWDDGPWRNGLRMGVTCLGCCWALMALAFVGGVTNLAFMGLATLLMTLEKLPDIGRWMSRPLGGALIGAAVVVALA